VPFAISTMVVAAPTCQLWGHISGVSVVLYQVIHYACELDEQIRGYRMVVSIQRRGGVSDGGRFAPLGCGWRQRGGCQGPPVRCVPKRVRVGAGFGVSVERR
jgi:hypothetical protein